MTAYLHYAHLLTVPSLNVDEYILFCLADTLAFKIICYISILDKLLDNKS